MKSFKLFLIIMFVAITNLYSQKYNGYKHIYIPDIDYGYSGKDIYGLSNYARDLCSQKGLIVITDLNQAPQEIIENKCLMLYCDITHSKGGWKLSVDVTLKDCKNNIIYNDNDVTTAGSAKDAVLKKSLKGAFNKFLRSYRYNPRLRPKEKIPLYPPVEMTSETEESLKTYYRNSQDLNAIEGIFNTYNTVELSFYRIGIRKRDDAFIAVILESDNPLWKKGEVKAYIEATGIENTYSIKWYLEDKKEVRSLCTLENGSILKFELKKNGKSKFLSFIKTFPLTNDK